MGTAVEQHGRGSGESARETGLAASVAASALSTALGKVAGPAGRGNTMPVLSHVQLEATLRADATARTGKLTLTATDLDQTVRVTIDADVETAGVVLVPHKKFNELVKTLAGTVSIRADDQRRIKVTSGRTKVRLFGMDPEEFPRTTGTGEATTTCLLPMQALVAGIGNVAFAVSTEESRPILNGVLWQLAPETLTMVATNGHRLALWTKAVKGSAKPVDLIVPPAALDSMTKLFHAEEDVLIEASGNWLTVRGDSASVATRIIEGPYPNYRQVIPTGQEIHATLDRKEVLALVRRVAILASDETHRVALAFTPDALTVEGKTADMGEATDTMGVTDYQGTPLTIGFNAAYLSEMLKLLPTAEIELAMIAPERAIVLKAAGADPEGETYRQLLMPLRIVD